METQLKRWGNSHGIRLPKAVLEQARLREGDRVEVTVRQGRIVITPARPRYTLKELLAGVTPENLHGEVDTGEPQGREIW